MAHTKTLANGNVCCWLLSALSMQHIWLNAHSSKHAHLLTNTHTHTHTHTHKHTQSYFSAVYQIWAYSSLVMSIYSRVHLGEPKLIEAHYNGLFISYWTDRPTPSLSLLRPSHLFLSLSRRYEEWSWIRLVQDSVCPYMGAPRSFVCLQNGFRIEFSQPHRLTGVFVTHLHTHTHTSHIYTQINTSLGILPNSQIGFVLFYFFLHSQS